MKKIALATKIPSTLKKQLDNICEEMGTSISHLTTEALQEKIDSIREDQALLELSLERLAEPEEVSYQDYKKLMKSLG